VLGRDGMGKTTLLDSIVGVTRRFAGTIRLGGRDVTALPPERRARAGIGWVPQERNIFRSLTVEENMTAVARPGSWTVARVYELFPRLRERRQNLGNQLSGGEQQMLAVGRALVLNPTVMLLDEPTEGLAPIIVEELLAAIRRVIRDEGMSAISRGAHCDEAHLREAETLLSAVGRVLRVPEKQQDAVTAISGSGPAYIFFVVEAMIEAGVLLGLPRSTATELVVQTLYGAATMLRETGEHPTVLREQVSSPAGTTMAALRQLDDHKVRAAFLTAMEAARDRSRELSSGHA